MSPIPGIVASQITGHLFPWNASDYESIATINVSGTSTTQITFSSIPSTYKHLQLRYITRISYNVGNYGNLSSTVNNDTTGTNYYQHILSGDGASASAVGYNDTPYVWTTTDNAGSGTFAVGVIDYLDYTNTNKYKTSRQLQGADNNGSGVVRLVSGLWKNTAAINRLDVFWGGSIYFIAGTQFALYGIKG